MAYKGYKNTPSKIRKNFNDSGNSFIDTNQNLKKKALTLRSYDISHSHLILRETDWLNTTASLTINFRIKLREEQVAKIKVIPIIRTIPEWESADSYVNELGQLLGEGFRILRVEFEDNEEGIYTYDILATVFTRVSSTDPNNDTLPLYYKIMVVLLNDRINYELRKQKT